MSSDESKLEKQYETNVEEFHEGRLQIPILSYFWQASPLASNKSNRIPKFLRDIKVFKHFTDYELKLFSNFLHERNFTSDEIVSDEGNKGFGFYLILNGTVEVYSRRSCMVEGVIEKQQQFVTRLMPSEYFGELALLEPQNVRNATAVAKGNATLLAIYKPDLEELITRHPVVGAKFLQALSLIVSRRFVRVTEEIQNLKEKCLELESKIAKDDN